ncbi:MAG: DUF1638 domain-containing protein [Verrucomicrobiota bacterium]
MYLKLIACDVFTREICHCVAESPNAVDLEFTPKNAHDSPDQMREMLQDKITAAHNSDRKYDAIALCLGLCGNAATGLVSPGTQLVIPRAHDCCTVLLGSRQRFSELFKNRPSTPFSSTGYMEHGNEDYMRETDSLRKQIGLDMTYEDCVRQYGEENAEFIWQTLCPEDAPEASSEIVFIEMPELPDTHHSEECRKKALAEGRKFEKVEGSLDLIRNLVFGQWDEKDFLIVRKGESITGVYDWDTVISAKQATEN